jgi:hypothetical protein
LPRARATYDYEYENKPLMRSSYFHIFLYRYNLLIFIPIFLIGFFFILKASSLGGYTGSTANVKHKSVMPVYDPLKDPHLQDYFERKFRLSSAVNKN